MAESVLGPYKNECVKIDDSFCTVDELELATLSWVHWFNENRLQSSMDYQTPIEAEPIHPSRSSSALQDRLLASQATCHKANVKVTGSPTWGRGLA